MPKFALFGGEASLGVTIHDEAALVSLCEDVGVSKS